MVAHAPELAPARGPGPHRRLAVLDPARDGLDDRLLDDLPAVLRPGDVLVVNDAATLPAAVRGLGPEGDALELRLARRLGPDSWQVAVLGEGTWRLPTEQRGPPPRLIPGDSLRFGALTATVAEVGPDPHLAVVVFGPGWFAALHAVGEPVRYSYLASAVPLAAFQSAFAARPWAIEAPSAGLPLRWADLLRLRRSGVALASVTHAAGLSSIDGGALDASLPLAERSDVPARTVAAIEAARAAGGRVVAVGTTVVRALEGRVADAGRLVSGESETAHLLSADTPLRVVDGILTKLHAPTESHFALLAALVPARRLADAVFTAAALGYRNHEFGDTLAIVPGGRRS